MRGFIVKDVKQKLVSQTADQRRKRRNTINTVCALTTAALKHGADVQIEAHTPDYIVLALLINDHALNVHITGNRVYCADHVIPLTVRGAIRVIANLSK